MGNRKTVFRAMVLGATFLAAACTAQTESRLENLKQNRVDLATYRAAVETDPATGKATTLGYRNAATFLVGLRTGYGDVVMIRGGSPEGRRTLVDGLEGYYRSVEFVTLPGGNGGLQLIVERAIATPPPCGDWSAAAGHDSSNSGGPDFGCSTEASLGLMVADPRDLQGGDPPGLNGSTIGVRGVAEMNAGPLIITPQTEVTETTE